jgi:hypothetical protein
VAFATPLSRLADSSRRTSLLSSLESSIRRTPLAES